MSPVRFLPYSRGSYLYEFLSDVLMNHPWNISPKITEMVDLQLQGRLEVKISRLLGFVIVTSVFSTETIITSGVRVYSRKPSLTRFPLTCTRSPLIHTPHPSFLVHIIESKFSCDGRHDRRRRCAPWDGVVMYKKGISLFVGFSDIQVKWGTESVDPEGYD